MLQDVSGRGTWSKKCFKMSLAEGLGARNASRCLWQRDLEQEMLQDVLSGARHASRCLWQRHLEQEMLQDVSGRGALKQEMLQDVFGRGTWGKKCFKSLAEALGPRNASRCLWQRHLEQEMLQDVSGARNTLAEALGARNASRCLWQRHLEQEIL